MANLWSAPFSCPRFAWLTYFEMSSRGLTRNPEIYDEPESFRPERFIDGKPLDPRQLIFGFGRRYVCPNL